MINIRRFLHPAARLAAVVAALLGGIIAAPAAFASLPPPPGNGDYTAPAGSTAVHTVTVGGTAGWQIVLLAVGAAILAAVVAVLLDRMRAARRIQLSRSAD